MRILILIVSGVNRSRNEKLMRIAITFAGSQHTAH